MRERTSAEQVVRALVDDALAGGGSDNVTVLVVAGARRS
jgi:serine/threonine protein phosphatase PrpC